MADNKRTARRTDASGRPLDSRHPLMRPVDRAEARMHRILVTLFLMSVPFAAVVGVTLFHSQQSSALELAARTSTVQASTTIEAPAGVVASDQFSPVEPTVLTPATWTLDGTKHVGSVPVAAHSPAGTTLPITVDDQGRRTSPPPTGVDVAVVSVFGAGALIGLIALALVVTRSALVRIYDRTRERDWDDALARLLS